MDKDLSAVERNVRLRNGRRALPVELSRPFAYDAFETLGHLAFYATLVVGIICVMYVAFAIADNQYRVIEQINQENSR